MLRRVLPLLACALLLSACDSGSDSFDAVQYDGRYEGDAEYFTTDGTSLQTLDFALIVDVDEGAGEMGVRFTVTDPFSGDEDDIEEFIGPYDEDGADLTSEDGNPLGITEDGEMTIGSEETEFTGSGEISNSEVDAIFERDDASGDEAARIVFSADK